MSETPEALTRDQATARAREVHDTKWRPVPGYPSGDPMSTSYRAERVGNRWLFTPAVAGLDTDPRKAETYPYYVVEDTGEVWLSPYADGDPTAA